MTLFHLANIRTLLRSQWFVITKSQAHNARSRLIQWSFRVDWVVRSERVTRIAKLAIELRSACLAFLSFSSTTFPLRFIQAVASFTQQVHPSTCSSMHTSPANLLTFRSYSCSPRRYVSYVTRARINSTVRLNCFNLVRNERPFVGLMITKKRDYWALCIYCNYFL